MPTGSNKDFALIWSSVELGKGELGVVLYGKQSVPNLMFKKKLLLLIILKYLDQLYDQLCEPQSPPSGKKTIDFLFKNKKNLQTFDKF